MLESIFRFLFIYPPVAYARGHFTLLSPWPRLLLALAITAGLAFLALQLRRRFGPLSRSTALIWALQSALLALLLLLLWRPALVVTTASPRQNIAAILLDDSASMKLENRPRIERVKEVFGSASPILRRLGEKFQVPLYRFADGAARIPSTAALSGAGMTTRLED